MECTSEIYDCICRLCLSTENKNMMPLYDRNSDNGLSCYGKSVLTFANISMYPNDNLPTKMCQKCLFLLKQAIKFKFSCERTNAQFCRIIQSNIDGDLKQKIVDYTMFLQFFPYDDDKRCDKQSSIKKMETNNDEYNSNSDKWPSDDEMNTDHENDNQIVIDKENSPLILSDGANDVAANTLDFLEQLVSCQSQNILSQIPTLREKKLKRGRMKRKCLILRKAYAARRKLKMEKVKEENKTYKCDVCNKILANSVTYRNHMQRHTGYKLICEHCGKGYAANAELQFHQVIKHGTGNFVQCDQCQYKSSRKCDLVEHIRLHTGERPFTCDKCGLTFRRRAVWVKHRLYHQEKTFQCPQCPRRFYLSSELSAHSNNVHHRRYMYVCNRCGATYAKPSTVRRHLSDRHHVPRHAQGRIIRINKGEQGVNFPEQ